jgi:hypothetical protein
VTHTLGLCSGFRCDGGVVLPGAHIGGQLDCRETILTANGCVLSAERLAVGGSMFLSKAEFIGDVRL